MYQKSVIDHCPWPSSQFNKWHAQNQLLSSSHIVIGSSPWFTPPSNQRTIVAARLVFVDISAGIPAQDGGCYQALRFGDVSIQLSG
jgi:hypothetical protein